MLGLVVAVVFIRQTHQDHAEKLRQITQNELEQEAWRQVVFAYSNGGTRGELEQTLNAGRPFTLGAADETGYSAVWKDPASGRCFVLQFDAQDRLTGRFGPAPKQGGSWTYTLSLVSTISYGELPSGPLMWFLWLVAYLLNPRMRSIFSELMLAIAIVWLTVWLMTPGPAYGRLGLPGYVRNPIAGLLWGTLLFGGSILAFVKAHAPARAPSMDPLCPTCRYNLTANQSGTCPECGQPIPADVRQRIERVPSTPATL
jgi:hypothetical protein